MKRAFPHEPRGMVYGDQYNGMTLREYFIGQALPACITALGQKYIEQVSTQEKGGALPGKAAIAIVDKLLEELDRPR